MLVQLQLPGHAVGTVKLAGGHHLTDAFCSFKWSTCGHTESHLESFFAGLQITMSTNHFGPWLLTKLLLENVKSAAPSRIIYQGASGESMAKLNWDDLKCAAFACSACLTKILTIS